MRKIFLFSLIALVLCLITNVVFAQVTVTKRDTLIYDPNGNLLANPGDSLRYKTNIKNTSGGDVNGAILDMNPSSNLGPATTIRTTPVALNDVYAVSANIGINVPAGSGLKLNDFDDNLALATIQVQVNQPTTMGGTVSVNADGSFTYTPAAGFTGADNFTYILEDGNEVAGCPPINHAVVTLNVAAAAPAIIWFIDNASVAATSDGRVNTPFKTLADFNASAGPQPGHIVFIENTGTNYTGGIVLKDNQIVWGTGHTGGDNLDDLLTEATFSVPLPAIGGTRPVVQNASGDGVTLAMNNNLRGFNVGDCSSFGMENAGTNSIGNLVVSEMSILNANTNGGAFDASHGGGASMNAVFTAVSSAGGVNGINLNTCGGTFNGGTGAISNASGATVNIVGGTVSLTYSGNLTQANNAALVSISGGHTTGTITFQTGTLSATNGSGLQFDNADSPTSYNFNGTVTLSGGPGINITNGSVGAFTFSSNTSITNAAGDAFEISGSNCNVTYSGSISDNAGYAIDIDNHDGGTVTFQTGNITSTGNGIRVANSNGGTINFSNATKSLTTGVNTAVDLASNTGGTMNFTGGGLVISTTTGTGFNATGGGTVSVGTGMSSNTVTTTSAKAVNLDGVSATINFATVTAGNVSTEGINLNNLSAASSFIVPGAVSIGMAAGSNSNINISTCSNCTIDIGTNGTTHNAVNLTSRRQSGIILNSVSGTVRVGNVTAANPNAVTVSAIRSTTCAGSIFFANTNVDMNSAGSNEGFTNAETPLDNNGDGDAIYINNFTGTAFTINGGLIENAGDDGIDIRGSRNLNLTNVTIEDVGKSAGATCVDCNSSGVQAFNLTGTNTVTNCSFQRGRLRNFYLSNTSGTSALNITGSTFNDTRSSGVPSTDNLQIYGNSTASLAVDIENSTFTRSATKEIDVVIRGNAQLTKCDITGITMDYIDGPSSGIFVEGFDNAQVNFNIMNNTKLHSQDENTVTISSSGAAFVQGRIKGNSNMKFNGSSPGGSIFSGIRVVTDGTTALATVLIEDNVLEIVNCDFAVNLSVQGANSAEIFATVNNNVITATGITHFEGILAVVNNTIGVAKLICLTINDNNVSGAALARVCRVRALSPTGVQVTDYVTDLATTWTNNGNIGSPVAEGPLNGGTITAAPMPCDLPMNPLP